MSKLTPFIDDMCCFNCKGDITQEDLELWDGECDGPVCSRCLDVNREMLERFWEDEQDKEWDRREQSRRIDREYVDRRSR